MNCEVAQGKLAQRAPPWVGDAPKDFSRLERAGRIRGHDLSHPLTSAAKTFVSPSPRGARCASLPWALFVDPSAALDNYTYFLGRLAAGLSILLVLKQGTDALREQRARQRAPSCGSLA
jgi:hypothetical protein